jgi:hypothetical protein
MELVTDDPEMPLQKFGGYVIVSAAAWCSTAVQAGVIYDESVSGDLSNSGLAPTLLTVSLASNQLFGTTGKTNNAIDGDCFTFTGGRWNGIVGPYCSAGYAASRLPADTQGEITMEPTKNKVQENEPESLPEQDGALSPDQLDKIAGGRTSDPCEGGQFHGQ